MKDEMRRKKLHRNVLGLCNEINIKGKMVTRKLNQLYSYICLVHFNGFLLSISHFLVGFLLLAVFFPFWSSLPFLPFNLLKHSFVRHVQSSQSPSKSMIKHTFIHIDMTILLVWLFCQSLVLFCSAHLLIIHIPVIKQFSSLCIIKYFPL